MPDPKPQSQLTGSLGGLQKTLEELGNTVANNVTSPIKLLNREFGSLGDVVKGAGKALAAMAGPTAAVMAFGEAVSGLVAKANPAVFQQFTLAMDDLMAVIGRALVPIFETVVIPVIRMAADSLMELAPAGAALAAALQPLVELIGGAFAVAAHVLAEGIKLVAPVIMVFARVLTDVVRFVSRGIRDLLSLIGITLPEFGGKPGGGVGAATRQAGHSSIDDVVKQAQRASFSLGTAQNDPMGEMANATKEIKARADQIYQSLLDLIKNIDQIPDKIGSYLLDLPFRIADALTPKTLKGGPVTDQEFRDKFGVSRWEAIKEAARIFGNDV